MIKFNIPGLVLDEQDMVSDTYPNYYHWVETNRSKEWRKEPFDCFFLKYEDGFEYYMPVRQPYEICRKYNHPDKHPGGFVTTNDEEDCKALASLVPENVVVPTFDFISSIPPSRWLDIYCEVVRANPDKLNTLSNYSFYVLPDDHYKDDPFFERHCLICYPFLGMEADGDILRYGEGVWQGPSVPASFHRRVDKGVGNVLAYNRNYYDDYDRTPGIPRVILKVETPETEKHVYRACEYAAACGQTKKQTKGRKEE